MAFPNAKNSVVCTEFPMCSKFNFSQRKTYFPNSLQILKLEVCGIYHSLYVKFEINVNSFILCKLSILFSTVKLRP